MEYARVRLARALTLLGVMTLSAVALSPMAYGDVISGIEVKQRGESTEVEIEFSEPVRYLRHSPEQRASTLVIQLDPLSGPQPSVPFGELQEFRRVAADNPAGIREVLLEGSLSSGFTLEVRFNKTTVFEVKPGGDPRRLRIRVRNQAKTALPAAQARRYAVQILSRPASKGVPSIPAASLPENSIAYTLAHQKRNDSWIRVRVGFYASPSEAEAARQVLERTYPGAWIVRVTRAEQTTANRTVLSLPPENSAAEATVTAAEPATEPAPEAPRSEVPDLAPVDPEIEKAMQAARDHLTSGQPARAVPILTKLTTLPAHPYSADAKELLGVARERNGQLAHAKAEYEEYLALYPQGEEALRVRQRLEAMLTAAKPNREALPESPSRSSSVRYELFGTVSSHYRFDRRTLEGLDPVTTDSSLSSDTFLGGRLRTEDYDVRSEFSGSYLADFLPGGGLGEVRLRTANVEVKQRGGPWSGSMGRRSPRGGGLIERYDGIGVRYGFAEGYGISATGGLPVNIFDSNEIRTDRGFAGLNFDFQLADRPISGEVFAVYYDAQGFVDRIGVGTELRYSDRGRSLIGVLDFDAYYQALNTIFLTGFYQLTESTHINALFDYRNSPTLRTSNALIGQTESKLDQLLLSQSEIEQFAEDRTARSTLGSIGVTHRLNPRFQISGDFSIGYFGKTSGSTSTSGDVPGTDAFGPDYTVFTQLIANSLIMEGDINVLGLRVQRGDPTNLVALILEGRYRALERLRIVPRFNLDHRENQGSETIAVKPSLRLEYRIKGFTIEGRGEYFWKPSLSSEGPGDETGFTLSAGLRYTF